MLILSNAEMQCYTSQEYHWKKKKKWDKEIKLYLPENVTKKKVFSKEIFGRAGSPIWLDVFQLSLFLS